MSDSESGTSTDGLHASDTVQEGAAFSEHLKELRASGTSKGEISHEDSPQQNAGSSEAELPRWRRVYLFIKQAIVAYDRDDVPLLSAAIAFYGVLALAPTAIILLTIADAMAAGDSFRHDVSVWLTKHVGSGVDELLNNWVVHSSNTDGPGAAVVVAAVVLLVSSTRLFSHIKTALDRIWHLKSAPPLTLIASIKNRFLGLIIIAFLGVMFGLSLALKVVLRWLINTFDITTPYAWVAYEWAGYLIVVFVTIYTIYRRIPGALVPRLDAIRGAALSTILLIGGTEAVAWYLARPGAASDFGAAGSTMALILWIYYATQAFLIGAIVTWLFAEKRARVRRGIGLMRHERPSGADATHGLNAPELSMESEVNTSEEPDDERDHNNTDNTKATSSRFHSRKPRHD